MSHHCNPLSKITVIKFAKTGILAFWFIMTALFLKKEIFPYFSSREVRGYRKIIPADLLLKDSWYGIYFKEAKIGYSHTQIVAAEKKKAASYSITTQALLTLSILGEPQLIWVDGEANLDESYLLKDFSFLLRLGNQKLIIAGNYIKGDILQLEITTPSEKTERQMRVPADTVVGALFNPFNILSNLKQKERFAINFFNPLTQKIETTEVEVLKKEKINFSGELLDAFLIENSYQGFKTLTWVDAEKGDILKQETPLGWSVVKEPQLEAMNFISARKWESVELAANLSVPANTALPPSIRYLKLRLKNLDPSFCLIEDERQKLIQRNSEEAILEIAVFPFSEEKIVTIPLAENTFFNELASSLFIPSDEPEIKNCAKGIVGEERNSLQAVKRIADWMEKNIQKRAVLSIPNAKDVLKTKMGDCNEYAYLFTALARAVGIPTKIISGLVYLEGNFFYHMWPEVYVGEWLAIDPVLNQEIADATHIKLVEGELANQLELAKILGKIEIEIIEYR